MNKNSSLNSHYTIVKKSLILRSCNDSLGWLAVKKVRPAVKKESDIMLHLLMKGGSGLGGKAAANTSHNPPTPERGDLVSALEKSMHSVLELLSATSDDELADEAMVQLGASAGSFIEPLGRHEVQVLGCALYMEKRQRTLTYHDVLRVTDQFSGKAMNLTMVYKTIDRLVLRGLLNEVEVSDTAGNRSRSYRIHGLGREAFRLAILNSRLLASSKSFAAA